MQGVTTIVTGNCGLSVAPLSEDSEEIISIILSHYKGEGLIEATLEAIRVPNLISYEMLIFKKFHNKIIIFA